MLDPVCDMIVDVAEQREQGLTIERPEREYAFCGAGCLEKFAKDPKRYIPKVEKWLATGESSPPRRARGALPRPRRASGPPARADHLTLAYSWPSRDPLSRVGRVPSALFSQFHGEHSRFGLCADRVVPACARRGDPVEVRSEWRDHHR
jgi:YHS domain-containing protein